jgi:hypothetical protein
MRVAQIAELIEILSASHDIIGADITGEYSPIQRRNPLFRTIAVADHPHRPPASRQELERNEETNLKLLAGLLR